MSHIDLCKAAKRMGCGVVLLTDKYRRTWMSWNLKGGRYHRESAGLGTPLIIRTPLDGTFLRLPFIRPFILPFILSNY